MSTIGNHQDAIIPVRRAKTSLKKDGQRFDFFFVVDLERGHIIGYEDADHNDIYEKVQQLQKEGWAYQ